MYVIQIYIVTKLHIDNTMLSKYMWELKIKLVKSYIIEKINKNKGKNCNVCMVEKLKMIELKT